MSDIVKAEPQAANLAKPLAFETNMRLAGLPEHLREVAREDTSQSSLVSHLRIPRGQMIHDLTKKSTKGDRPSGLIMLSPGGIKVCDPTEPFVVVPLKFYSEAICWSDRDDTTSDKIRERTLDENHPLFAKARNEKTRQQPYGEIDPKTGKPRYTMNNTEHLNFIVSIAPPHPLAGTVFTLGFSKGEYRQGKAWIQGLILGRAPIWCQRWKFQSHFREEGPKKSWWGLNFSQDAEPFISKDAVEYYQREYNRIQDMWNKGLIVVEDTEDDTVADGDAAY